MTADTRTPTEELILDTLGARARLGEAMWTFTAKLMPALRRLEGEGLVYLAHGVTERTARAGLTKAGRDIALPGGYVAPIFQDPNPWQKWSAADQDRKHTCWWCLPVDVREETYPPMPPGFTLCARCATLIRTGDTEDPMNHEMVVCHTCERSVGDDLRARDREALEARLVAVRELHQPHPVHGCDPGTLGCRICGVRWPCPTVQAAGSPDALRAPGLADATSDRSAPVPARREAP